MFHRPILHRSGGTGARPPLGDLPPIPRGRSADWRWCGTPHPLAALRLGLSLQRKGRPVHNADRHAFRRFAAAFSLNLGTAFWRRKRAAIAKLLDPAGFFAPAFIRSLSPLPDGPT